MSALRIFKAWYHSVAIFSIIASSADAAEFAGGTGEPNDPYQIATAQQLISIGSDPNLLDKHFVLINDIDLDPNLPGGQVFTSAVIAPYKGIQDPMHEHLIHPPEGTTFTGHFDGNSNKIRNLTIHGTSDYLGLFGRIGASGWVHDLGVENTFIVAADGSRYLGGLAGYIQESKITNCYVTGRVVGGTNTMYIGGLVGFVWQSKITYCFATSDVYSGDNSENLGVMVGGNGGDIINCYASGNIVGGYGCKRLGGLVGLNGPTIHQGGSNVLSAGLIIHCYENGTVSSGNESNNLGGLVGDNYESDIISSFWDIEASGMSESAGGTGVTTVEMQNAQTYLNAGWDLVGERGNGTADLWQVPETGGYPELTAFSESYQPHLLEGTGTPEDPYEIATAEDLGAICHYDRSACYILVADIDLNDITWTTAPIADFDGTLNGADFVVSNLTIQGEVHLGLFDTLDTRAKVMNLRIEDANISGGNNAECVGVLSGWNQGSITNCFTNGNVTGYDCVGGLVGYNSKHGSIHNCYGTGNISSGDYGRGNVGGLVGLNIGMITDSRTYGEVDGTDCLGGLVGTNVGKISNCYASGEVTGYDYLGGLVGNNYNGTIVNSYATVSVFSRELNLAVGGLVGNNDGGTIVKCYAAGSLVVDGHSWWYYGGLVGVNYNSAIITDCFWDVEASGLSESAGGTGLSTAQMQTAATFLDAGWDFVDETDNGTDDIWKMPPWTGYPLLAWQEVEMPAPAPIAHWAFDEGSGDIATDSAGDNHGTIYNPEWAEGKINGALQFNGFNTYVDCGDSDVLGPEQMTLAMWLEPGHMGGMRYILSRANKSTDDIDYTLTIYLTSQVEFTVGQLNTAPVSVLSNSTTPLNEWSHVAVNMDGSELSVYINGNLDVSANYAERGPRQGHRLVLSSYQGSTRFYFGKLDDVRIYDTALSEDDIEALYTDGLQ